MRLSGEMGNPFPLKENSSKSFIGSYVLGMGFVLTTEQAATLIAKDPRNKEVLFPYLNGDDLNNNPEQKASRWIINFFDWPEDKARSYPDCFEIVERLVRPERQRWKLDKNGNEIEGTYALRKPLPQKWWIYAEKRPALYKTISKLDQVIVVAQVSKTLAFTFVPTNQVISMMCVVLAFDDYFTFSLLQSTIHQLWVQKYASALKSDTRYTPSDVFETFPFLFLTEDSHKEKLTQLGKEYFEKRRTLMQESQLGLTKIYNQFHKKSSVCDENIKDRIEELRTLHTKIDEVIIEAYGWADIQLEYGFYSDEDTDRIRFTISPNAQKEILIRLLRLNHKLHVNEVSQNSELTIKVNKKEKKLKETGSATLF